jgi:hypothetical protein
MKLVFSNNQTVDLTIHDSPLGATYQKIYKNLSHVPIPFRHWDNPYYKENLTYPELVNCLVKYAQRVSVDINIARCIDQDQEYFNNIHKIYENNYNGDPAWLDFHEHIHMCENYFKTEKHFLCIDYREKSGLLEKAMDPTWLLDTKTKIQVGDIYVQWSELGKTPYNYWKNNEPNDITRMCELVKPWLKLRPKIYIALEDIDMLENIPCAEFESWWNQYSQPWSSYWKISNWTIKNIFGVSVFGKTTQVDLLKEQLKNNAVPVKVSLQ